MGGGGGGWNPVSAITDPISSALGTDGSGGGALGALASIDPGPALGAAAASIDPGPAISKLGVEIDKGVNNMVPGGWVTVAAVAACVAMPYMSAYLAAEGATLSAAEFAAYDMANLAAQGISESQMLQIGVASGMDAMVAADMASMAAQGLSAAQMASTVEASYTAAEIFTSEALPIAQAGQSAALEMPVEELEALKPIPDAPPTTPSPTPSGSESSWSGSGIKSPSNPLAGGEFGINSSMPQGSIVGDGTFGTNIGQSYVAGPNGGFAFNAAGYPVEAGGMGIAPAGTNAGIAGTTSGATPWWQYAAKTATDAAGVIPSSDTLTKLYLGSMLAPTVLDAFGMGPKAPGMPSQTLPDIPDTKWGSTGKLVNPGVNPGWIQPTDVYTQTNPTDAKFYWGSHPYMATESDLPHYNAISNLPITPWGHHDQTQPLDVNQFTQTLLGGPYAGNPNMPAAPIAPKA